MTGRLPGPRRQVVDRADGYGVTHYDESWSTTDRVLAVELCEVLDRADPVPGPECPHEGDTLTLRQWGNPRPIVRCVDCGSNVGDTP